MCCQHVSIIIGNKSYKIISLIYKGKASSFSITFPARTHGQTKIPFSLSIYNICIKGSDAWWWMFCNCWSKNCHYPNTCLADGTLGSPHFMAIFSSVSKSPLPACWKMHYLLATGEIKKHDKIGIRSMLPLLVPRFLYQNSDSVCEQAQPMNHASFVPQQTNSKASKSR